MSKRLYTFPTTSIVKQLSYCHSPARRFIQQLFSLHAHSQLRFPDSSRPSLCTSHSAPDLGSFRTGSLFGLRCLCRGYESFRLRYNSTKINVSQYIACISILRFSPSFRAHHIIDDIFYELTVYQIHVVCNPKKLPLMFPLHPTITSDFACPSIATAAIFKARELESCCTD